MQCGAQGLNTGLLQLSQILNGTLDMLQESISVLPFFTIAVVGLQVKTEVKVYRHFAI